MPNETQSSIFFFPLRTNVEYFDTPEGYLSLKERIKQACILYDRLIFEGGLYQASIGPTGSFDLWIPPLELTDAILKAKFTSRGGEHHWRIAPTGSENYHTVISGPMERWFRAEFHTALREFDGENMPWIDIETYELTPDFKQLADSSADNDERDENIRILDASHFFRRKILTNLNRDLILIASLGTSASIDPLHASVLEQKMAKKPEQLKSAPGFLAIEVAVPNFSNLPWDTILELREHPSLSEFRRKLVEAETTARTLFPDAKEDEIRYEICQIITGELVREISNVWSVGKDMIRDMSINAAIELLLVIGRVSIPFVGEAIAAVRDGYELMQARNSWITAFLRLRGAGRSAISARK
jgi:hypothetical protein